MTFGSQVDPQAASYYQNLTGFWRGDVRFHNLTKLDSSVTPVPDTTIQVPPWHRAAADYIASANATLTNATELTHKLGSWNWTRSKRVDISFGDKIVVPKGNDTEFTKDIALIHVRVQIP